MQDRGQDRVEQSAMLMMLGLRARMRCLLLPRAQVIIMRNGQVIVVKGMMRVDRRWLDLVRRSLDLVGQRMIQTVVEVFDPGDFHGDLRPLGEKVDLSPIKVFVVMVPGVIVGMVVSQFRRVKVVAGMIR